MKILISMYKRNTESDNDECIGKLLFENDSLSWIKKPSNGIIETVMEPISIRGKEYSPKDTPKEWIENVWTRFENTYFSISKPIYINDVGERFIQINSEEDESEELQKSIILSTPPEILPGELTNQNSQPIKVDVVEEQKSKTPQSINGEPYYEKSIMKSIVNDWFYNLQNLDDKNTQLVNLKLKMLEVSKESEDSISELFSKLSEVIKKSNGLYNFKKELENVFKTT